MSAPDDTDRLNARADRSRLRSRGIVAIVTALLLVVAAPACKVNETRSGLPAAVQAAIDNVTDDIAAGRDEKIYAEAAEEWRRAATPEESRAMLARVREVFGRVSSRALIEGREQQTTTGPLGGHIVTAKFNTRFERADAIETFTLVERDGRWLLARYSVHSDALR